MSVRARVAAKNKVYVRLRLIAEQDSAPTESKVFVGAESCSAM